MRRRQLEGLISQAPTAFPGHLAALFAAVVFFWSSTEPVVLALWAGAVLTCSIAEFLTWLLWRRSRGCTPNFGPWLAAVWARTALHGAAWGSMAPLFLPDSGPMIVLFVVAVLLGLSAAGQSLMVSHVPIMAGYVLGLMGPVIVVLLGSVEDTYVGLGLLGIVYYLVIFDVCRKSNGTLLRSWRLQDALSRSHEEVRLAEERYRGIFESVVEGVYHADEDGRFVDVNPGLALIVGEESPEAAMRSFPGLAALLGSDEAFARLHRVLAADGSTGEFTFEIRRRDGESRWVTLSARLTSRLDGYAAIDGTLRDITDRQKAEQQLVHLAHHDSLTGLPNRVLLQTRVEAMLAEGQQCAVHILDLDRFKHVNDSFGHHGGDQLLAVVSRRLCDIVAAGMTLARLGGDEFAIVQPLSSGGSEVSDLLRRVSEECTRAVRVDGREVSVGVSVGSALFPEHGHDFSTLLRRADMALYAAKAAGRGECRMFSHEIEEQGRRHRELIDDLRQALRRNELSLHYQPKLGMASGKLIGAEALLRWQHPDRGFVSPAEFIPVAEETGLIAEIGEWAFNEACRAIRSWPGQGVRPLPVAVNLSGVQLEDPKMAERFRKILFENHLNPAAVEFELTESEIMSGDERKIAVIRSLADSGVRIAIDDFGTGYSSLAALCDLPVTDLKIDRRFINDIDMPKGMTIVSSFTNLAHELGLTVTAEGIEDVHQLCLTRKAGCDAIQGYWYSRPLPAQAMLDFMRGSDCRQAQLTAVSD